MVMRISMQGEQLSEEKKLLSIIVLFSLKHLAWVMSIRVLTASVEKSRVANVLASTIALEKN